MGLFTPSIDHSIKSKKWNDVEKLLISKEGVKLSKRKNRSSNWYTLHSCCYEGAPFSVINILVHSFPEAIKEQDRSGNFPIHHACLQKCSFEVIELLLLNYPESALRTNKKGNIPLHNACYSSSSSTKVIKLLLMEYPKGAELKNRHGNLPLHLAIQAGADQNVLDELVDAFPEGATAIVNNRNASVKDAAKERGDKSEIALDSSIQKRRNTEQKMIALTESTLKEEEKEEEKDDKSTYSSEEENSKGTEYFSPSRRDSIISTFSDDLPGVMKLLENGDWYKVTKILESYVGGLLAFEKNKSDGWFILHAALYYQAPKSIIKDLLEINSEATKEPTKDGKLPLHFACHCNSSLEVVQLILHAFPNATRKRDDKGWLPLHFIACDSLCDNDYTVVERISIMLDVFSDAVEVSNCDGQLPLHLACYSASHVQQIKALLDYYPKALMIRDNTGLLPLHYACMGKASLSVIQEIASLDQNTFRAEDEGGVLPLHVACQNQASLEVIDILTSTFPDATKHRDADGWLPLHYAYNSNPDIIENLLNVNHAAVQQPDNDGCLAIHVACYNAAPLNTIQSLISAYPPGLIAKASSNSFLPIHYASVNKAYDIIQLIITYHEKHESGIDQPDSRGRLPLHFVCSDAEAPLEIVQQLLKAFPNGAKIMNHSQNLPLHFACQHKCSISIVHELLQYHSEALQISNFEKRLPLHVVCEYQPENEELLKLLVNAYPLAAASKDSNSDLPLHIILHQGRGISPSFEIISILLEANKQALETKNKDGKLPFQIASENDNIEKELLLPLLIRTSSCSPHGLKKTRRVSFAAAEEQQAKNNIDLNSDQVANSNNNNDEQKIVGLNEERDVEHIKRLEKNDSFSNIIMNTIHVRSNKRNKSHEKANDDRKESRKLMQFALSELKYCS